MGTVAQVGRVLVRHLRHKLTAGQWIDLMGELCTIDGGKSYRDTMVRLAEWLKAEGVY